MIYDCFTFFNELDLLEIRLNYLNEIVDKFVLVEMNKTHSNIFKPLYFEENKQRFKKFLKKIIHIKITEYPKDYDYKHEHSSWFLENYQRDSIMQGLKDAKDNDIVIISDVDEIPSIKAIKEYKRGIGFCRQKMMYYFLNNQNTEEPYWTNGTRIGHLSDLKNPNYKIYPELGCYYTRKGLPTYFRFCFGHMIEDGGWHFSYLGGTEAIMNKIRSFAHQEFNTEKIVSEEAIFKAMTSGQDILGRKYIYKPVPFDETFPKYILDHKKKFKHLIVNIRETK
ncbi:hypothetical protein IKQ21_05910 [bacterium]|nr:hypothetical protein [bacterium]